MPTALERTAACGGDAGVTVSIRYFAILREERGQEEESVRTAAATVAELYDHLRVHFSFSLPADRLRVACNGDFVSWSHPLHDDDLVVFIPPVAGG